MTRLELAIKYKETGGRISILPEWSHSYAEKGFLLITPDYIPGSRISWNFRSMPEGYLALAFIHEDAEKRGATMCIAGTNHYIFYPENGDFAEEGMRAFAWEITFDNHIITAFAEIPDAYVQQELIERLVAHMADVVESAKHA